MEATRRLDIELPDDVADAVEARVSAGEYGSVSEVIREGLLALAEREEESVLGLRDRENLAAAYDEWKADPGNVMTVEEVRQRLAEARQSRG